MEIIMNQPFPMPTMKKLREAAKETGLSYNHLRQLCLSGKIVCTRVGNRWYINMEKLAEYLNGGAA